MSLSSIRDRLTPAQWFWAAIGAASAVRLGAYAFLAMVPISFNPYKSALFRARRLSPFEVVGIDIEYYIVEAEKLANGTYWRALLDYKPGDLFPPPLTSFLIWIFDYGPGHAWPLSLLWMALSLGWAIGWIAVLRRRGLEGPWLAVIGLMPVPVFYQFAVGTDLLFAALFLIFYVGYRWRDDVGSPWLWIVALMLMTLTRASAVSVVAFVAADMAIGLLKGRKPPMLEVAAIAAIGAASAVGHMPWLFSFMVHSVPGGAEIDPFAFFGQPEAAYRAGLFAEWLPGFLDRPLSMALLIGAKALHFCGLRPSFEATSLVAMLARSLPALIVAVPGLVWCLWRGDIRDRLLVLTFLLPAIAGLAQERYALPILPLFVLYCAEFWARAARKANIS